MLSTFHPPSKFLVISYLRNLQMSGYHVYSLKRLHGIYRISHIEYSTDRLRYCVYYSIAFGRAILSSSIHP